MIAQFNEQLVGLLEFRSSTGYRDVFSRDKFGRDRFGRDRFGRDRFGRNRFGRDVVVTTPTQLELLAALVHNKSHVDVSWC